MNLETNAEDDYVVGPDSEGCRLCVVIAAVIPNDGSPSFAISS